MSLANNYQQLRNRRLGFALSAVLLMGAAIFLLATFPDIGRMPIIAGGLFGIGVLELIVADFILTKKSDRLRGVAGTTFILLKYVLTIGLLFGAAFAILVLIAHQKGKQTPHAQLAGNAFFVLGDNRSGDDVYRTIVAAMVVSRSSEVCLINTGDLISTAGHPELWLRFLQMTAPIAAIMPWYGAVGNHEVNSGFSQRLYQWILDFPGNKLYYSFDALNSHFIVLDTEIPGQVRAIRGAQLDWLKQDLQTSAPKAQQIFVFTHRPLFPQGSYRGEDLANAAELHQLFRQYRVKIVFSGHEHQFYLFPKDTVTYVVTGGAGAPLSNTGPGKSFYHYLRVELLATGDIRLEVHDIHGKLMQTEMVKNAAAANP